jgi:hypothetical protein
MMMVIILQVMIFPDDVEDALSHAPACGGCRDRCTSLSLTECHSYLHNDRIDDDHHVRIFASQGLGLTEVMAAVG